ncbi:MAG: aminotransferase class I/II-fold pyridoxal phosphate-dependent enzyme [Planctomycetes bacterium]|nr:aminotransferase class I/II-fold pyridoxal phosphate-dependent enzyme [Planctomycetota bacterium]MCB9901070.1 aminotransferase class I/II-fold pyridoxal phosphate-dependent enzyme [Planctomycetota bacterium]
MSESPTPAEPPPVAAAESEPSPRPSLSAHYHAARLRGDTWAELKRTLARLTGGTTAADRRALEAQAADALARLGPVESYWAFPGPQAFKHLVRLFERGDLEAASTLTNRIVRALASHTYRRRHVPLLPGDDDEEITEVEASDEASLPEGTHGRDRPYFEVLIVDNLAPADETAVRAGLHAIRRDEDEFVYDVVIVPSFEDAVIAVLFNFNIQTVVVRYDFPFASRHRLEVLEGYLAGLDEATVQAAKAEDCGLMLGRCLHRLRPELDLFLVTDVSVEELDEDVSDVFRRVFYRQEDFLELHLSILRGIASRHRTPFFSALRAYAGQPTGVFHALPISRGKSVVRSNWIRDMAEFYGLNIFLAETSTTSGGLDSLLDPKGTIKDAQALAARAFGARKSYFVTNGTSTANKIVSQALLRPGDIALVDRNCHKSHHYAMVLAGAHVIYLDSYPLDAWSIYGAVPQTTLVDTLRRLQAAGRIDRVKMVVLTNCTFDGIVYHPEQVMEACLAIKPDLVFLWDEAWFAFARFSPMYRSRTGMEAARVLRERYKSAAYRERYAAASDRSGLPDPDRARVRVYVTQSTHKTLTALRQGSMIHVHDQDWPDVEHAFRDAFMTHTSTSPNYQILASLDVGRRQVELEGFELVQKQLELAFILRQRLISSPLLRRWFRFLAPKDLVPMGFRASGMERYYHPERGWAAMEDAWATDEFVVDPSRLTLDVASTGVQGETFRHEILMRQHGIQVNKTSRNTVLFMTHIGTTRSSVAHLIDVLTRVAHGLDEQLEELGPTERASFAASAGDLRDNLPPLPDFSRFHDVFRSGLDGDTPEGDMRRAYFLAADEANVEYLRMGGSLEAEMARGRDVVAALFLTPYPPGFPLLVPGQVVSEEILAYLRALELREVHGYRPDLGLRVLKESVLEEAGR